ncbi:hypothetical protein F4804DRAFT_44805 [Jackrogersella minutella]|nr:hypothetical protein F4804DRAFT_44805 [Jackrogersella minutella]
MKLLSSFHIFCLVRSLLRFLYLVCLIIAISIAYSRSPPWCILHSTLGGRVVCEAVAFDSPPIALITHRRIPQRNILKSTHESFPSSPRSATMKRKNFFLSHNCKRH